MVQQCQVALIIKWEEVGEVEVYYSPLCQIDLFFKIDIVVKIDIPVKIDNYVNFYISVKVNIFVKLSTFQLLTFLSIAFDIFINI